MQPDSREPPQLRECNYSHNISHSLHCKKSHLVAPLITLISLGSLCMRKFLEMGTSYPHTVHPSTAAAVYFLTFLQYVCDKSLSFFHHLVFPAATSVCHIGYDGKSLGVHSVLVLVTKDTHHLKSVHKAVILSRDLFLVR